MRRVRAPCRPSVAILRSAGTPLTRSGRRTARLAGAAALALALAAPSAHAGTLLEGELRGLPIRVEQGSDPTRVRIDLAGKPRLVDLAKGDVWRLDQAPPERVRAATLKDPVPLRPFSLEEWSEGPLVAGHGTTYHVLIIDEQLCGEVLSSPWMKGFTDPLIHALDLLERSEPRLAPAAQDRCGRIPLTTYAADGFPMMASYRKQPAFKVVRLRFDHRPAAELFATPP